MKINKFKKFNESVFDEGTEGIIPEIEDALKGKMSNMLSEFLDEMLNDGHDEEDIHNTIDNFFTFFVAHEYY